MASSIYMTCGISGSGKSTFAEWFKKTVNAAVINMVINLAELGSISDRLKDEVMWKYREAEALKQIAIGKSVILSNTNLNYNRIKKWTAEFPLNKVVLLIMEDSFNLQLCKDRIAKDRENGIIRKKMPEKSDRQYVRFNRLLWLLSTKSGIPKNLKVAIVSNTYDITEIDDLKDLRERIDESVLEKEWVNKNSFVLYSDFNGGYMMPNIYMTVGIAGSGKSTFAQWIKNAVNAVEINADNVRAELGGMSDMSHEEEVWKRVSDETVKQVAGGNNVILSNTNLHYGLITEQAYKFPLNKVVLLIMEDSFNLQLCKNRIAKDLENGVERSKVPPEVSDKQYARFHLLLRDLSTKSDTPKNLKVALISDTFDLTTIDDLKVLGDRVGKCVVFEKKN